MKGFERGSNIGDEGAEAPQEPIPKEREIVSEAQEGEPRARVEEEKRSLLANVIGKRAGRFARTMVAASSLLLGSVGVYTVAEKVIENANEVELSDGSVFKKDFFAEAKAKLEKEKEEKQPITSYSLSDDVLENADKFVRKSWGKDAIITSALTNPTSAFKHADKYLKYLSPGEGEGLLRQIMQGSTYSFSSRELSSIAFESYEKYRSYPFAHSILREAIKNEPDLQLLVRYANAYWELPDAQKIFDQAAASTDAETFILYFTNYRNYAGAEGRLKETLRPANAAFASRQILEGAGGFVDLPWTHDIIRTAAAKDPRSALKFARNYIQLPDAKEILGGAVRDLVHISTTEDRQGTAASDGRNPLWELFENYKSLPNAEEVLHAAVQGIIRSDDVLDKRMILQQAWEYPKYSWFAESIAQIIVSSPGYVPGELDTILERYGKMPGIQAACQKAFEAALAKDPKSVIFTNFSKKPWLADIVRRAIEADPMEAIGRPDAFGPLKNGTTLMERAFRAAAHESPRTLVGKIASEIANQPYALAAVKEAAKQYPEDFLTNIGAFDKKYYRDEFRTAVLASYQKGYFKNIIKAISYLNAVKGRDVDLAITNAIKNDPKAAYESYDAWVASASGYYRGFFSAETRRYILEKVIEGDPEECLSGLDRFEGFNTGDKNGEILKKLVFKLADTIPEKLIDHFPKGWQDLPYFDAVIERAFLSDPLSMSRMLRPKITGDNVLEKERKIISSLAKSRNQSVRQAFDLADRVKKMHTPEAYSDKVPSSHYVDPNKEYYRNLDNFGRMCLVLASSPAMEPEKAMALTNSPGDFFRFLIQYKTDGHHAGGAGVERELTRISLQEIESINYLHERSDRERFKSVETMSSRELYTLMAYGEQEIFTSSFNGLFNRMGERMKKEHLAGDQLLAGVGNNKFRNFVKMASNFNRLQEFLSTMKPAQAQELLTRFIKLDEGGDFLDQAVAIADTFSVTQDPAILRNLRDAVKNEYERVSRTDNQKAKMVYGLLAGMFAQKNMVDDQWALEMSQKYKLPNLLEVRREDLFNPDGSDIQEYFFYDDNDGKVSFQNFLAQYQKRAGWKIEEAEEYVKIVSETTGGKHIEIFANKPDHERDGPDKIEEIFKTRKINSIVIVHRGHSYHAQETIKRIPPIARIVALGSCGGYHNLAAVLERSPEAHIISTKGTGTQLVNDPILASLNDRIKQGEKVNWPSFWAEMESKLGGDPNFKNYVPPHRNLGVTFLKAYHRNLGDK